MKVTLYIRAGKRGHVKMWTRQEEEPNYGDSVRILNLGHAIATELDAIINRCEDAGVVSPPVPSSKPKTENTQEGSNG